MEEMIGQLGLVSGPLPANAQVTLEQLYGGFPVRGATYFSTPMTGGPMAERIRRMEPVPVDRQEMAAQTSRIVQANAQQAAAVAQQLRDSGRHPYLINPVDVEPAVQAGGWTQNDCRKWWLGVMNRYMGQAVFNEGWASSTGCVVEMTTCLQWGVPCHTVEGAEIVAQSAVVEIDRAMRQNLPGAEGHVRLRCRERLAEMAAT